LIGILARGQDALTAGEISIYALIVDFTRKRATTSVLSRGQSFNEQGIRQISAIGLSLEMPPVRNLPQKRTLRRHLTPCLRDNHWAAIIFTNISGGSNLFEPSSKPNLTFTPRGSPSFSFGSHSDVHISLPEPSI